MTRFRARTYGITFKIQDVFIKCVAFEVKAHPNFQHMTCGEILLFKINNSLVTKKRTKNNHKQLAFPHCGLASYYLLLGINVFGL